MEIKKALIMSIIILAAITSIQADDIEVESNIDSEIDGEQEIDELPEATEADLQNELRAAFCDIRDVFPDEDEEQFSETEPPEISEFLEQNVTESSDLEEPDNEYKELEALRKFWFGFDAGEDVKFYLFSRQIWTHQKLRINKKSFSKSKFNRNHPIRIVIHGWMSEYTDMLHIKDAYIKQGDVNVIMVDWSLGAADPLYVTARWLVGDVGKIVAKLIKFMVREDYAPSKDIHVVGFSLGAHISGFVGKYTKSFKIPVIVGLDPAEPLFDRDDHKERIDKNDGAYVAIIHTSDIGLPEPLGHADFYVNYGSEQPGCGYDLLNVCSHNRATKYFAESINSRNFKAIQCQNANQIIKKNHCKKTDKESIMTTEVKNKPHGVFLVHTKSNPPFAKI